MSGPVRHHAEGAVVAVRAVPGASRAALIGLHGAELRIRVCSPPVDGRANDELCAVLADALGLRAREVRVVAGHTARSKQLLVALDEAETTRRLEPWIGRSGPPER
ncbi:MAG: hypothetical protein RL238_624 [Actinomycetota bacterium]|jgi:uncharacterized protein (TIGR00251 family)